METYNQQRPSKKWNQLFIIIAAPIFNLLFYQQDFGLNLSLFSFLTVLLLVIRKPKLFQKRTVILKTIAYLITGFTIFLYHSNLVIIANILAFFTLIGSTVDDKSSLYINWINGIYTTSVAAFTIYFERLHSETENVKKRKINYVYWFKIIGIPFAIVLIFISLYRNGNPKFDALIAKIDFSFIDFGWIVFTALGYFLLYNITNPVPIEPVTSLDLAIDNNLVEENSEITSLKKLKSELQLGTILLISLNILILLFLVTDVLYLSELHQMSAPELSKQVHTGVNALILSNLLAIAIILYFFRASLNFTKENTNLKKLTFAWIFLNLLMIIITAIKNMEYLVSFGLTYKRIGVLFFLFFTAIGLITTYIKVTKVKNLWFLFRKNLQIAFTVLIISSTLNWDKLITYFNINYAEQLDISYLIDLSNNNTFLLKDYVEKQNVDKKVAIKINTKHSKYVCDLYENTWQELVFDNYKIQ